MKKMLMLITTIIFGAVSLFAQAVPKQGEAQSARRYINLPKPVQASFQRRRAGRQHAVHRGAHRPRFQNRQAARRPEQEIRIVLHGIKSVLAEGRDDHG